MKQGTTPAITINLDVDLSAYDEVWLTIEDRLGTEITKKLSDGELTVTAKSIIASLSQADTLRLHTGAIKMQVRALQGESAIASNIMATTLEHILKDGEISV